MRLVHENWRESELAVRHQIDGYPAVFIGDVPVALPADFGFFPDDRGKYTPFREEAKRQAFRRDVTTAVRAALAGSSLEDFTRQETSSPSLTELPDFTATVLGGGRVDSKSLAGKVVVVDFWATWCPPCRRSLTELNTLAGRYSDVVFLPVSVQCDDTEARELLESIAPKLKGVKGDADLIRAFGNVTEVPRLQVFDRQGQRVETFYGAPQDLPQRLTKLIRKLR